MKSIMMKVLWKSLLLSPIMLVLAVSAASVQATPAALASIPQVNQRKNDAMQSPMPTSTAQTATTLANSAIPSVFAPQRSTSFIASNTESDSLGQVTSVSQLSDVQPTDWAFQSLQSLVERYGCIAGYPDGTYQGNRALTRYEFAAGLNACLDRVNELIASSDAGFVKKEDLETIQKLQDEFAAELATLRGRVDTLEARTNTLEKQQFSTTTKLGGEVIFSIAGVAAGNQVNGFDVQKNPVFGDRVRLDFDTSFTGKDLLRTRLQASNLDLFSQTATGTPEGDFRFTAGNDGNNVGLDALLYQFPLGDKTTVIAEANAGAADDFTNTVNPFFDGDGGSGALTHFGTRNPIYYLLDGTGVGIRHQLSKNLELSTGYLATDANDPTAGKGLFNGPYGAIAQLTFTPSEKFALGLTYIHSYKTDFSTNGSAGSHNANFSNLDLPFDSNAYGLEASYQISPKIVVNGSVGYTNATVLTTSKGNADIWNWEIGLAFPDLWKKGSVAGFIVGMEPKVTNASSRLNFLEDQNTSLHIEGFYQYQLTDNITITPGIVWLTNPDHNSNNDDEVIGAIRTTFSF